MTVVIAGATEFNTFAAIIAGYVLVRYSILSSTLGPPLMLNHL